MALLDNRTEQMLESLPPEKLQAYKQGKQVASNIINERIFKKIADQVEKGNGVESLALATVMVLDEVENRAGEMDQDVLLLLGANIIGLVADALNQTGRKYTGKQVLAALQTAITMWLSKNQDRVDDARMQDTVNMLGGQNG